MFARVEREKPPTAPTAILSSASKLYLIYLYWYLLLAVKWFARARACGLKITVDSPCALCVPGIKIKKNSGCIRLSIAGDTSDYQSQSSGLLLIYI